jgi:hypothetical protein
MKIEFHDVTEDGSYEFFTIRIHDSNPKKKLETFRISLVQKALTQKGYEKTLEELYVFKNGQSYLYYLDKTFSQFLVQITILPLENALNKLIRSGKAYDVTFTTYPCVN